MEEFLETSPSYRGSAVSKKSTPANQPKSPFQPDSQPQIACRMPQPTSRPKGKVPAESPSKVVVSRMSLYLREVQRLVAEGQETINSRRLGGRLGFSDAQVRKDFAAFGLLGYPGRGYKCAELVTRIKQILGTDRIWPVALVGCGNLGQALLGYNGFLKRGFDLVAAFDISTQLIGKKVGPLTILDFQEFPRIARLRKIQLAMLAVPANAAEKIAETISRAGITGILNFAPVVFELAPTVTARSVDLAVELEQLAFAVVSSRENG